MNRRTFNKFAGLGAMQALAGRAAFGAQSSAPAAAPQGTGAALPHAFAQFPARTVEFPTRTYRRLLVDSHIPDWDERLFASFDAADYVSTIAAAGFQSLMQYARAHVGLCLWRTKIGEMHRNMKGRDYFGEVMDQCHRHGLHRVAYYSLIYDDWAYRTHPDWRNVAEDGSFAQNHGRTGTVCINSPYTDHTYACLKELVANYDFESIFLDMTFWSEVCYCEHCTARFWKEQNAELPRIVDWTDPAWRTFQRSRERWMREFAMKVTETIKQTRPIQVYHQGSTLFAPWTLGISLEQFDASDLCGGDFYGGAAQFSLVCKAYQGLSRTKPFEFMTSRTTGLGDFETAKPFEKLALESMIPMIHSAGCLLIDAFNPDGTLNHSAYQLMSQVNALHEPYEGGLGGDMLADVAIYFDRHSTYDPAANGLRVSEASKLTSEPHLDAVVGTARILREAHIPFGVVTNASLDQLSQYRAVILPGVLEMTVEQAAAFRHFVGNGGVLLATGVSSLSVPGEGDTRFLLGDVLGVRYLGKIGKSTTYLTASDKELGSLIWPQQHIGFNGPMVKVEADASAQVLATVTLPFVDPDAGNAINTRFAQIWSSPPNTEPGKDPGIVEHSFGRGTGIWIAAPLETRGDEVDARVMLFLLKRHLKPPFWFEADAHPAVEVTLFEQTGDHRLMVGMLNLQEQVPTVPVTATLRVKLPDGHNVNVVVVVPSGEELKFARVGPYVSFQVPAFKLVTMVIVDLA